MTAAEQGRGKNLRNATKESARSAEHRVESKIAHIALLTVRASAPKEMLAIIGILLSAGSSRQGTAQLVRNSASYIHLGKEIQQLPHQSRKARTKKIKRGKLRKPPQRARLNLKPKYFFMFLRLSVPALLPSRPRKCASQSSPRRSR